MQCGVVLVENTAQHDTKDAVTEEALEKKRMGGWKE